MKQENAIISDIIDRSLDQCDNKKVCLTKKDLNEIIKFFVDDYFDLNGQDAIIETDLDTIVRTENSFLNNPLWIEWSIFKGHLEDNEVELCNKALENVESMLLFESEREHSDWLDLAQSFKFFEDFEEATEKIILRGYKEV
jgi:hypothetical protein